jgi:cation transporter-like permease
MGRRWRYVFLVYAIGAFVMLALCIQSSYASGGFQRHHSLIELLTIAALLLATTLLWPVVIIWVILIYFGLVPDTITL